MNTPDPIATLNSETLLEIIKIQTEISKLGLDLGGVMSLVTQRSHLLTRASGAVVEIAEGDDMVYRAASGMAETQLGLRLSRHKSLSGLCVRDGKILSCDDSETDERADRDACRKIGLRSMLVVPLKHLDSTVGVLKVMSSTPSAFSDADAQVLSLLSEQIAAAMFHAVRFEANELYHRATHDALTGLANRALFYDRLRQCMVAADRHAGRVGILNIDMDGLKPINDEYGHRAGDAAIREVATRANTTSRQSDTVARLGGDEFGVILSRIDNREGAMTQSERLAKKINAPFVFEQRPLLLSASIGCAVYPDDGKHIEEIIDKADQSMYEIKRNRKMRR